MFLLLEFSCPNNSVFFLNMVDGMIMVGFRAIPLFFREIIPLDWEIALEDRVIIGAH
ncbi:hypothetical protein J7E37_09930 [Bacillus sp. ISL-39]|nr:hypothetical protein [Bacillus sp. ISL-39]